MPIDDGISVRHDLRPGDLGRIIGLHGAVYAQEQGFNVEFEAYVAGPLAEFARHGEAFRQRLWIAERRDDLAGCIAIVPGATPEEAQVRWFLVHPSYRRRGLGRGLLSGSLQFAREAGYHRAFLWTVSTLPEAASLYAAAGFRRTEQCPAAIRWGVRVIEERYELEL